MNYKDFKLHKILFGLFFEEEFNYKQNKGSFFNNLRNYLKVKYPKDQFQLLSEEVLSQDIYFKLKKPEDYMIKVKSTSLHLEGNFLPSEFVNEVYEIYSIFKSSFPNLSYSRYGMIVYFEKKDNPKKILKNMLSSDFLKQQCNAINYNFHYHYTFQEKKYHVNLILNEDINENSNYDLNGSVDFAIKENFKVDKESFCCTFKNLYDYYKENLFKNELKELE